MTFIESLHDRFKYEDGKLMYKKTPITSPYLMNREAGSIFSNGYRVIVVGKKRYPASHIVWAMHKGELPTMQIDHRNHNTLDNRIENLRQSTHSENQQHKRLQINNRSGYKGVIWSKIGNAWRAQIRANSKFISLGYYDDIHDAAEAYNEGAIKYHGEFAKLNIIKRAKDGDGSGQ